LLQRFQTGQNTSSRERITLRNMVRLFCTNATYRFSPKPSEMHSAMVRGPALRLVNPRDRYTRCAVSIVPYGRSLLGLVSNSLRAFSNDELDQPAR
jgi:hypothetical protein